MPKHQHGWECFRTSGGYTTAMEKDGGTWAEKVERIYKTAYATGHKNGMADRSLGDEQIIDEQQLAIIHLRGRVVELEAQLQPKRD
jgi:hypothetical protein